MIAISNKDNSRTIETDFFIGVFYHQSFLLFQSIYSISDRPLTLAAFEVD